MQKLTGQLIKVGLSSGYRLCVLVHNKGLKLWRAAHVIPYSPVVLIPSQHAAIWCGVHPAI